jgi:hypothetical protein
MFLQIIKVGISMLVLSWRTEFYEEKHGGGQQHQRKDNLHFRGFIDRA